MIGERGDQADVVKVLDFGLARTTTASQQVTRRHLVSGTPAYIAPERFKDSATVDARSDIFSIGAVAYFLLTGRDSVEGSSPEEVILKIMTSAADPPSGCWGGEVGSGCWGGEVGSGWVGSTGIAVGGAWVAGD